MSNHPVAARDKAEHVKTLVEQLKAQNRREAVEHRRIYRPWGYYQGVDTGARPKPGFHPHFTSGSSR